MKKRIDFLMVYPHRDIQAYSQRILLGVLDNLGYSVHLLIVSSIEGIQNDAKIRDYFLRLIEMSKIVGFGFMSNGYDAALYLTKLIKANFERPVIWGGPHPTISYRNMIGQADAIFVGESDKILPRYLHAVFNNEGFSELPQVITNEPEYMPPRVELFMDDLDRLPMPFYSNDKQSLILSDCYKDNPEYFRNNFGGLQLMTSRGCPYSCSYCANSYLGSFIPREINLFRKRGVDYVIREIKYCQQSFNISNIAIEDDLFLARTNDELKLFVEKYNSEINLPIGITGITPSFLKQDKIEIICRLPLVHLRVGIQTMSETGLDIYKRKSINMNLAHCLGSLKSLNKRGILMRYDIILDNPYETMADNVKTLRFVSGLPKPFRLLLYHLTLYEGTELRTRAIAEGVIDKDDRDYILRPYSKLDDSYINALFRFVESAYGLVSINLIELLTSPFILNYPWVQKPIKSVLDFVIIVLNRISLERFIFRWLRLKREACEFGRSGKKKFLSVPR